MEIEKQQQELIRLYWHPSEKVWVNDCVNNIRWPAIVEAECVSYPGWVWVRETYRDRNLSRVRTETLEGRQ